MGLRPRIIVVTLGAFALMFAVNTCLAGSPAGGDGIQTVTDRNLKRPQQGLIAEKLNPKLRPPKVLAQQLQNELKALQQTMAEVRRLSERLKHHQTRLARLNSKMSSMGEDSQMMQLQIQDAMQKQSQMMQTMSNIMKSMHDTQMAIIRNIR